MLLMACCGFGSSPDAAVRSALNVLTDVVSPASRLAYEGCRSKEDLLLADAKLGKISSATATTAIQQARERCDAIRKIVDTIRMLHEEASTFVEAGNVNEAEHRINAARAQFRTLMLELEEP
jgi:hypothetical protein